MIIITAVGADRPGMAHAVADVLARAGCNIEDTTMTRLSGEFAMILIAEPAPGTTPDAIAQRLAPLEASHGLFINCKDIEEDDATTRPATPGQAPPRYILSAYGPDKTGLLARVTGVLAEHGVNITDVQTRVASGHTIYVMIFEIEVPSDLSIETLQAAVDTAAREIGVQASLRPLEEETL